MTKYPNFQVGEIVTLSLRGRRHIIDMILAEKGRGSNPIGISGTVTTTKGYGEHDPLPIRVKWDNGTSNSYDKRDLEYFNLSLENE